MDHLLVGCGYLGARLVPLWLAQGMNILATTRAADRLHGLGVTPVVCDVLDPPELPAVDTVVYCVGFDRASGLSMRQVYVDGLARMLRKLPPPRRFVYVSSTSVYGQDREEWVDEESPTEPREESGRIVIEAETVLREQLPEAMILRFAGIYGPGRLLRQRAIKAGEPIAAEPDRWLNLIHVEDGARAVLAAAERGRPGRIYNVCDGRPVRRRDFYAELARVLQAPTPCYTLPPSGTPHEQANRRLGNRRMIDELAVEVRFSDYRAGLVAACGLALA